MYPYGLKSNDLSQRPLCPCCRTKYHGAWGADHATECKDRIRRAGAKRARQAGKNEIRKGG